MKEQMHKEFLERLAKGVAELFGQNCEVTVHDLSRGYENTVIAIENGHVTGRRVGDGSSEMVLRAMKEAPENVTDNYNYLARTKNGRILKSSTIYLRNDRGKILYLFGINYDVTDLIMAKHTLDAAISATEPDARENMNGINTITSNVNDLLDQLIAEADRFVGKPVAMMTKDDKVRAIQFLNDRGAFLVKKAGDKVSKHYDISKYTLYNYMSAEE